jgi:hypothetical protein
MGRVLLFSLWIFAALAGSAGAQTSRPLSTDRPDRTESPYSVPKGWLQLESDVVSHGELQDDDETLTGTSICSLNLKYGVTPRVDLQIVFSPWVRLHAERPGSDDTDEGTGQAGLRAKFNITGNDGGDIAAALLPFAFIPTRGDPILDAATWGFVTPVSIDLGDGRAMSSMLGAMRVENEDWWVIGSVSFATPVAGAFASFFELYVARAGLDEDALEDVTADTGITVALGADWQLDAGVYYGITEPTEDWRVFAGASGRFSLSR